LRKLANELCPQGVQMADLLSIFVELADNSILHSRIQPALNKHYQTLMQRSPLQQIKDVNLQKGV